MPGLESAQRHLDALRAAIDARLAELESALDDPSRAASLASLMLELSRLATSEAQAAAARACLLVQHDGEAALLEAEARSSAAVEAERRASSELRRALDQARRRLDVVEAEKHSALQTAQDHARQLESERTARVDLDRSIGRLERDLKEAQTQLADARAESASFASERADLRRQVQQADAAGRRIDAERDQFDARIKDLERQVAEARQRADAAEQRLASASADAAAAQAGERARTRDQLQALEQQVAALQTARDDAARKASAADDALTTATQELAQRSDAHDQTLARIDALATSTAALTADLETERTLVAQLRSQLQAAHAAIDASQAVERNRETAVQERDAARQEASELRAGLAALQDAHAEARRTLEGERAAAAELRGLASGSSDERTALLRELERATSAKTALEASLADARNQLGSGEASAAHLASALAAARSDLERARLDISDVQQRLSSEEHARASLAQAADQFEARLALIEQERDALSLALDTERMTTHDLRATLDAAQRVTEALRHELADLRQTASAPPAPPDDTTEAPLLADDEDGEVTELRFEEDELASADDVITLEEENWESLRQTTRYNFNARIDITVNGKPAVLTDLSLGGCGIRSTLTLEDGQQVRLHLPGDPAPLVCIGTVAWVRLDAGATKTPGATLVGIQFTQVDEAALEAFIIMHADL